MKNSVFAVVFMFGIAANGLPGESKNDSRKKDECLLDSTKCEHQGGYPILEKIERLKAAIGQGTTVYSPEELERLKKKLHEAEEVNDLIQG